MSLPNSKILNIELENNIMTVKFQNGDTIKFIDVKEWEYNEIISSSNQRKSLEKFAKYKPNY